MAEFVEHILGPIYDENSKILILGTMPSPKSREVGFYYAHPQNRFWPVLSQILHEELPQNTAEKVSLLLKHHIALWDVLKSCTIEGADDNSIREPVPNNINIVLNAAPIGTIYTTGTKSATLYKKLCLPHTGRPATALPSTSPANCRFYNLERLIDAYRILLTDLK